MLLKCILFDERAVKFCKGFSVSPPTFASRVSLNVFILRLLCAGWMWIALSVCGIAQWTNARTVRIQVADSLYALDSLSIVPSSFSVKYAKGGECADTLYTLDVFASNLRFSPSLYGDSVTVQFRVFPSRIRQYYAHKDSSLRLPEGSGKFTPYRLGAQGPADALLADESIRRSGSISRGVAFGNAQNLTVNSTLNLQLSGKINERFSVLGSITDDNIPIQPNGNSQQLQDFDQVFIQLYDDRSKLIVGDFVLRRPNGYFLNYFKRAQGAYFVTDQKQSSGGRLQVEASASISKGRFARNVIQGVEGNQGPYRLQGADGETFIIVLAGTEAVFIDGRQLERGQDKDYVIDYNAAEIIFTPRHLITKDRRIAVEFQYSERRYARPMLQSAVAWSKGNARYYTSLFSEGDARNQPLQQDLTADDRRILSQAGDDALSAVRSGITETSFSASEVRYALVDSLGFDSVLVFSTDPALARFRAVFSPVGAGNGDYVEDGFTANGRKYRWIAPEVTPGGIVRKGSFAPVVTLATPKNNQMLTAGTEQVFGKNRWKVMAEGAVSNADVNTFSAIGNDDNIGFAFRSVWAVASLKDAAPRDSSWRWNVRWDYEYTSVHFRRIERFREVEFERNWNLLGANLNNDQHIAGAELVRRKPGVGRWSVGAESFQLGNSFTGIKAKASSDIKTKKSKLWFVGSYLNSNGLVNTRFLRHKSDVYHTVRKVRIGFADEFEFNRFYSVQRDSLAAPSYRFYDWQVSLANADTAKWQAGVYFRQRTDDLLRGGILGRAAIADEYGGKSVKMFGKNHRLSVLLSNRILRIADTTLTRQAPENTLVSRLEYSGKAKNGWFQWNTFYEVGSGLEQRREFVYLEVQPGQGVYVWNDYNNNGVRELNEFEVAAFGYEANFIRTFIQTADYTTVYNNQFSQVLQLYPERVFGKSKGPAKWLARLSSQTAYKSDRKTGRFGGIERFNPLANEVQDSLLIATNTSFRQILFLNKNHPLWGAEFTYQELRGKSLLSNGFETRTDTYRQAGLRWNITPLWIASSEFRAGTRSQGSDFLIGRNFVIDYTSAKPRITWQPKPTNRWSATGEYTEKSTRATDTPKETAVIVKAGFEGTVSSLEKGSLQVTVEYLNIRYTGEGNSSLAFEMLEGLNAGDNFVWSAGVQRTVAKNLQLNITYNGRRPEGQRVIHTGGLQLRAFF